jgi:mannose-6-phosphate isomerase-like protein (cupin superfamily)
MKPVIPEALAMLLILSQAVAFSQGRLPPKSATDVTNAEILTILKMAHTDEQIKVVDIGKYNVAVGILHRGKTGPGASTAEGVNGLSHNQITEVYYIVSGSGTLVTGGTMADPRPSPPEGSTVKVLVGPTMGGVFQNGQSRNVGPGDVIIIPPGVPHGFSAIEDHVDYLAVRVDADHVLPAGYVHEAVKAGASK